ncbi:MAG: hypothetical protein JNM68_13045 [Dinghuibacter sp.]|nr:hypothetical protein [Dinghuibacter sp.]
MKQLLFALAAFLITHTASAQKVKWTFTSKKLAADKYELRITATVPQGWHIYSQSSHPDGPIPTKFTFNNNALLSLDGKVKEVGKLEKYYDDNFKVEVKYFSNKVEFVQVVKMKGKIKTNVSGQVESMICDNKKCMPPSTEKFNIALK